MDEEISIDTYALKSDLVNYLGTAAITIPAYSVELGKAMVCSVDDVSGLLKIANDNGFDVSGYIIKHNRGR